MRGRQFAFVVAAASRGVGDPLDPRNADRVAAVLAERYGLDRQHHLRLLSPVDSANSVRTELESFVRKIVRTDSLLLYLYGHGKSKGQQVMEYSLLFPDGTSLTLQGLLDLLNQDQLTDVRLVIDACQSGCVAEYFPKARWPFFTVVASARPDELGVQKPAQLADFTEVFTRALETLAPAPGNSLKTGDLFQWIEGEMARLRCPHTPQLGPPGDQTKGKPFLRVEECAARSKPRYGSLREFGRELLDLVFAAPTRFGHHSGRPDAKRIWLIYLNSVGNIGRAPAGGWPIEERALLEAILEAEAGAAASGPGPESPVRSRGSWIPFCAFLYCYACEWLRLCDSPGWPAAQRLAASTTAQQLINRLRDPSMDTIENCLCASERDRWAEMAGRLAEKPVPIYVSFDAEVGPRADVTVPSALLRLACRAEPLGAAEPEAVSSAGTDGVPDLGRALADVLHQLDAKVSAASGHPAWTLRDLEFQFFLTAEQAGWPVEATRCPGWPRPLGREVDCRTRLRDRHLDRSHSGAKANRFASAAWQEHTDLLDTPPGVAKAQCHQLHPAAVGQTTPDALREVLLDCGALIAPDLLSSPAFGGPNAERQVFDILRDCGTVAAVWARRGRPVPAGLTVELVAALADKPLTQWPAIIRECRRKLGADDPGLAFVCDPCDHPELPCVPGAFTTPVLKRSRSHL